MSEGDRFAHVRILALLLLARSSSETTGLIAIRPSATRIKLGTVSEQNVELHRRVMEAYNARDIGAFIAYCHPQIEFHSAMDAVGGGVYHGHDGLQSYHRDAEETWGSDIRLAPEAYFDLGEHTLAFLVAHGRGRQSGGDVALPGAQVLRWRDGLIVFHKGYVDWASLQRGLVRRKSRSHARPTRSRHSLDGDRGRPGRRHVPGYEGVRAYWQDWLDDFDMHGGSIEESIEAGDRLVCVQRAATTGKGSGVRSEIHYACVYTFGADERIVELNEYATREEALAAVQMES